MKKLSLTAFLLSLGMWWGPGSFAQGNSAPEIRTLHYTNGELVLGMSDNGEWAVAYNESDGEESCGKLIRVATGEATDLPRQTAAGATTSTYYATDVSNDGAILVGCFDGAPAAYSAATGWRALPMPAGWSSGIAVAITPDARWAVGRGSIGAMGLSETAVLWDMQTLTVTETPNLPLTNLEGIDEDQVRFVDISADGRYIIGCTSFTTMGYTMMFVYDRNDATWRPIGFDYDGTTHICTPQVAGLGFIDVARFSPNGRWIGGTAQMSDGDYYAPFRYDMQTGEFELFNDEDSRDMQVSCIDNDGNLLGGTPHDNAVRSLRVRCGNYWFNLDHILSNNYGIDFYAQTGLYYTGTPGAISDDGCVMAVFLTQGDNYVIHMPETFTEATADINLLSQYTATPADGSTLHRIAQVEISFGRDIEVTGANNAATLTSADGETEVNSSRISVLQSDGETARLQFRSTTLQDGTEYTLHIPAGTFCVAGDEARLSPEITLHYTGRDDRPLQFEAASPAEGSLMAQLNASTNPVVAQFDAQVVLTDTARAVLLTEGETDPVCELEMMAEGNRLAIYPATTQYLYLGTDYIVRIFPGSFTDVSGYGANEMIDIHYSGAYERTVTAGDGYILEEDFNNGITGMMLYDGDRLTPTDTMATWGFSDNMPWSLAADDDNMAELCAVSHSMYNPAGQSDDWMVTPQCYIPDARCVLRFRSQSFLNDKVDSLKVIVYTDDIVINTLTADIVERMWNEGTVIYNGQETPGRYEGILVGDWQTRTISLADFAGRNIYVAFVNRNNDQSAIFVDDIRIGQEKDFNVVLNVETTIVGQESMPVAGRVGIVAEDKTFNDISLSLLDADNNALETISEEGLSLSEGDEYTFSFEQPLPLTVGAVNHYAVRVQAGESVDTLRMTVRNMAFEPVKRLAIEEYTGMDCPNCPQGILAMERLEALYGERIIPIAYHTYPGDIYASDLTTFVGNTLGMNSAPSARINRGDVTFPMYRSISGSNYDYMFNSPDGTCWLDVAETELAEYADANMEIQANYDSAKAEVSVPYEITYALSQTGLNVSLQLIITEDNLRGYQTNNLYTVSDPDLDPWGAGGANGESTVIYTFNDVARAVISYTNYGDLVPVAVEAGKAYTGELTFSLDQVPYVSNIHNCHVSCLLVDNNTGRILNAATASVYDPNWTSISATQAQDNHITVTAASGTLNVTGAEGTVSAYTTGGTLLDAATAHHNGTVMLHTGAYKGIVIVKAGTAVRKVMMK